MMNSDKAFIQAYNAQVIVDSKAQVIVSADVSNKAVDSQHLPIMLEKMKENIGGIRRIKAALASEGITVGRRLIKSKMVQYGLVSKAAKRYKATTNSRHHLPVAPNLLEQKFDVSAPNKVWVSDFT